MEKKSRLHSQLLPEHAQMGNAIILDSLARESDENDVALAGVSSEMWKTVSAKIGEQFKELTNVKILEYGLVSVTGYQFAGHVVTHESPGNIEARVQRIESMIAQLMTTVNEVKEHLEAEDQASLQRIEKFQGRMAALDVQIDTAQKAVQKALESLSIQDTDPEWETLLDALQLDPST